MQLDTAVGELHLPLWDISGWRAVLNWRRDGASGHHGPGASAGGTEEGLNSGVGVRNGDLYRAGAVDWDRFAIFGLLS